MGRAPHRDRTDTSPRAHRLDGDRHRWQADVLESVQGELQPSERIFRASRFARGRLDFFDALLDVRLEGCRVEPRSITLRPNYTSGRFLSRCGLLRWRLLLGHAYYFVSGSSLGV